MRIFKPITDISDFIQRSLDATKESLDNFMGKGLKGGLKDIFDFSAEGLIQKADFDLGIGILHLTIEGDREAVDVAIKFRKELAARLDELDEMSRMVKKFKSEEIGEVKRAAKEMAAFLERGEGEGKKPSAANAADPEDED